MGIDNHPSVVGFGAIYIFATAGYEVELVLDSRVTVEQRGCGLVQRYAHDFAHPEIVGSSITIANLKRITDVKFSQLIEQTFAVLAVDMAVNDAQSRTTWAFKLENSRALVMALALATLFLSAR